MPKFKVDDIILPRRTGKKRLIMGVEIETSGKIYYHYYNGTVEIKPSVESLTTKNTKRCTESTMDNWGTKQ